MSKLQTATRAARGENFNLQQQLHPTHDHTLLGLALALALSVHTKRRTEQGFEVTLQWVE